MQFEPFIVFTQVKLMQWCFLISMHFTCIDFTYAILTIMSILKDKQPLNMENVEEEGQKMKTTDTDKKHETAVNIKFHVDHKQEAHNMKNKFIELPVVRTHRQWNVTSPNSKMLTHTMERYHIIPPNNVYWTLHMHFNIPTFSRSSAISPRSLLTKCSCIIAWILSLQLTNRYFKLGCIISLIQAPGYINIVVNLFFSSFFY